MNILAGLTTTEQVRATLGVTSSDLPDSVIIDFDVETDLSIELVDWLPEYEAIRDNSGHSVPAESYQYVLSVLKLYCKFWAAARMAVSAQNYILQRLSDGDNEGHRFTNESLGELRKNLELLSDRYKQQVVSKLTTPQTAVANLFSVVTPSYDPVSNS